LGASRIVNRRSFIVGAAGTAAACLFACTDSNEADHARTAVDNSKPTAADCPAIDAADGSRLPLWQTAFQRGIVYGSSTATWQLSDATYRKLFERQAAILFTEDDLLWYRLRPTPQSELDFEYGDQIIGFAERNNMLVLGAHLVWDNGFGEGWTDDDLWGMNQQQARDLILETIDSVVGRYRGRVAAWIVVNEALDGSGLRRDVPWYATIGPSYVNESFQAASEADPDALLVLNEFGYETDDGFASAVDKRAATLQVLDELLDADVPVHALGIQAHLNGGNFVDKFDPDGYRGFLGEVADRGLKILVTEMDILDDGLPSTISVRDRRIADVAKSFLDVALDEPAVASLVTFGLSDRYTWLEEDYPRKDGMPRRPLPFDQRLRPKPEYHALESGLNEAPLRDSLWVPPRC
jgi:endo-1,4-beta-xylanase